MTSMFDLIDELWFLKRDIVSDGFDQALERLAGELPDASLVVIPQAGHVPHEERPDLFMQAVDTFLATLR